MFYSLTGKLVFSDTKSIAVECGGIAYYCNATFNTIGKIGGMGSTVKVYTYLSVRENAIDLFGFADEIELEWFKMLIGVTGIGPKIAIGILSGIEPSKLALCIAASDYKSLTNAPGVGNKTAQRIVLELKDKITNSDIVSGLSDNGSGIIGGGNMGEAIGALNSLGYSQTEAATALKGVSSDTSTEEIIKIALKKLGKK